MQVKIHNVWITAVHLNSSNITIESRIIYMLYGKRCTRT